MGFGKHFDVKMRPVHAGVIRMPMISDEFAPFLGAI